MGEQREASVRDLLGAKWAQLGKLCEAEEKLNPRPESEKRNPERRRAKMNPHQLLQVFLRKI